MIKTNSSLEAWKNAVRYVLQEGKDIIDKEGGPLREALNMKIEIIDPSEDIAAPIEKISSSKMWVYPRLDEIANIALTRKGSPGHVYVYGQRIFNYDDEINQIDKFVIPLLRKNRDTRRAIISLWEPKVDSNIYNKEVPSMMLVNFVIDGNKLNVSSVIRSNNVLFGLPANIYQIYLLQEYVAQRLDLELGSITLYLLSAHLLDEQFDYSRELISE